MSRLFTPEVVAFAKQNNRGKSAEELTELLNHTFGTSYTAAQIKGLRARNHWDSGLTGHFTAGHTPHNKGVKGRSYPGMAATQFKKGDQPHNHRPVGSERRTKDGYMERKIAEPNVWRAVHVLKWEEVHGPVPKGHVLLFKDHNQLNVELDNLLLITRGELAVMNRRGWCCENPEATESALYATRYIKAATSQKKKAKEPKL